MPIRHLIILLTFIGLSVYGALVAQTDNPRDRPQSANHQGIECPEVELTVKPGWAFSGGFTSDGSQLRVVDSLYETILRYSESGESLGAVGQPLKATLEDLLPVTGKAQGDSFIVEISGGLMTLDKQLRPATTKRVGALSANASDRWNLHTLWQWEPVGKGDVVGFADLLHGTDSKAGIDQWRTGFVRFPLNHPEQAKVLGEKFEVSGTQNMCYFRSGYYYITSIGETAYILSMNEGLTLYENEKGSNELADVSYLLPSSLNRPELPQWLELQEYAAMMKEVERESLPVGLFGSKNMLYLLYKTAPSQGKGVRWDLYRIDPSGTMPTRRVDLPIRASHVTVIPGRKKWAFLEKGPVLDYGVQDTSRVLLVPADLIESPSRRSGTMLCRN